MIANNIKSGFRILVDGDACPVKDIISQLTAEYALKTIIFASIAHKTENTYDNIEYIWVDNLPQEVDMAIINNMRSGDLIVTGDFGLASLVLAKEGQAISPRGMVYHAGNIEKLLLQRHVDAKIRRSGGRTKGPKPLSDNDVMGFTKKLREILDSVKANENFSQ